MTFLNPLLLFGLAAAAIPLVLHLLNRRKLRTIEFSSVRFLTELQRTAVRRLKLRQILLLILRTLVLVALVLAFSRPVLRSSMAGPLAARAATTMVFLLDDSPSMGIRDAGGVMLGEVASSALRVLDAATPEDHLCLIPLSAVRMDSTAPELVTLPSAVRKRLETAGASPVSGTIHGGLSVARRLLASSSDPNHELYILTDAQATQFPVSRTDSGAAFDDRTRAFLIHPPPPPEENLSVEAVDVTTRIIVRDRPAIVEARVRNNGPHSVDNTLVSFYLDGARVAQQSLSLPPHAAVTARAALIPKRAGSLAGSVTLEDDELPIDNTRYFVLPVPDSVRVLICSPDTGEGRYSRAALTLGGDSSVAGLFTVSQEPEGVLPSLDLNAFDVLLLCGLRNIRATDASRLAQFVKSGGGIILFPSLESGLACYNEQLFPRLRMPASTFRRISPDSGNSRSFLSFSTVDFAHPLFAGMFEPVRGGKRVQPAIQSPRIYSTFSPQAGGAGRVVIGLTDGTPFLTEYTFGEGRILSFSVEAGPVWSDFPTSGIYAPLLHRAVLYLAKPAESPPSFICGDPIETLRKASVIPEAPGFLFRSPVGIDERTVPKVLEGSSLFRSAPTDTVGVYTLREGTKVIDAFPVNVSTEESDLRAATGEELDAFFRREGIDPSRVHSLDASEDLARRIEESRFGVELWKYVLGLAILLAVAEMIIARDGKEETAT